MISILIPVYNHSVIALVTSLLNQLSDLKIEGEIIVMDDNSERNFYEENSSLGKRKNVQYFYLQQNAGRLKIRKKLSEAAKFEWLIYIDGDSIIPSSNFLQNYIQTVGDESVVLSGGRIYQAQRPTDCLLRLHWKYGCQRENIWQNKTAFQSNNFCIHRAIIKELKLSYDWPGYGHEDTLMGIELEKSGCSIGIINNPVIHDGIEVVDRFIEKSTDALNQLITLTNLYGTDIIRKHVKLYRYYLLLKKLHVNKIAFHVLKKSKNELLKNLHSCSPSLFYFDLYRLEQLMEKLNINH